jgi:hypothetical protein
MPSPWLAARFHHPPPAKAGTEDAVRPSFGIEHFDGSVAGLEQALQSP